MSRVDSVRIAIDKARAAEKDMDGAALASDAFFPFADGPQLAIDAGVRSIIQPGGSQRDDEVIAACDEAAWRWSSPPGATSATDAGFFDRFRTNRLGLLAGGAMREPHHPSCQELELSDVLHA